MRFWLWLTTSMLTKEWVAIHRKHHRYTEQIGDPHSPHVYGILNVLFRGAWLYNVATKDKQMINQYGVGTPNDWIENNLYSKYTVHGILILLIINTILFNGWGIVIWLIQMAWIPFWAAGVINGLGHFVGYRNNNTNDKSKNLFPIALIIGGEELHNNHHQNPSNIKLSQKWYEFDLGWLWIKIFLFLRLAKYR
jgi:stearoyl-CoA desaturase (delta-9 desaturase)